MRKKNYFESSAPEFYRRYSSALDTFYSRSVPINDLSLYSDCIVLVVQGSVDEWYDGEVASDVLIATHGAGSLVGLAHMVGPNAALPLSYDTTPNFQARATQAGHFLEMLDRNKQLMRMVIEQMYYATTSLATKMAERDRLRVSQRIFGEIRRLAQRGFAEHVGDQYRLSLPKQTLGRLAGCSREAAGRSVRALQERGIIVCERSTIYISDELVD